MMMMVRLQIKDILSKMVYCKDQSEDYTHPKEPIKIMWRALEQQAGTDLQLIGWEI